MTYSGRPPGGRSTLGAVPRTLAQKLGEMGGLKLRLRLRGPQDPHSVALSLSTE